MQKRKLFLRTDMDLQGAWAWSCVHMLDEMISSFPSARMVKKEKVIPNPSTSINLRRLERTRQRPSANRASVPLTFHLKEDVDVSGFGKALDQMLGQWDVDYLEKFVILKK